MQNLLLAARALEVGSVPTTLAFFGGGREKAQEVLNLPDHILPMVLIPLGWPTGNFGPIRRRPAGRGPALGPLRAQDRVHRETKSMTTETASPDLRITSDVGRYTIAKSFEVTARSITAFAGGVDDFNPVYFEDDRPGGLVAHPGMVFSWQWNSRFTPDVEYPLELVRRGVHAWVDIQFERHAREGDVITSQGQSVAVKQVRPGVLSAQRFTFRGQPGRHRRDHGHGRHHPRGRAGR